MTRRSFISRTAVAGASLFVANRNIFGANERISVGVAGCGGKGKDSVGWATRSGAEVVAVCDPDKSQMSQFPENIRRYQDVRDLIGDSSVDAVIIATPNHWHSLATIWACQAGKDVYVEKPACHSIWEGRKMVEAARKYKRIVQVGTQHRSCRAYRELRSLIAKKELGELRWVHSLWYSMRPAIGKTTVPTAVPAHVNYDHWCGPREKVPLMRKNLHYDWHWLWNYGNADMGNHVIHVIDDIHNVLQMGGDVPTRMMSVGKRFRYDDDSDTPNTQFIVMDWKIPIVFDCRNLPLSTKSRTDAVYQRFGKGFRFTNLIKCEHGFFAVSRGGGTICDNSGNVIRRIEGDGGEGHMRNFLDAVRSRKQADLHADVEEGHLGCLMLHTGNISQRIGREATAEEIDAQAGRFEESRETWKQTVEHLRANDIDIRLDKPILGPWLAFDPRTERFIGEHAREANALVRDGYRQEYAVPEKV